MIVNCNCKNDFQDKEYGIGKRVANLKKGGATATCTVCGTKHSVSQAEIKKEVKK